MEIKFYDKKSKIPEQLQVSKFFQKNFYIISHSNVFYKKKNYRK